MDKPTIIDSLTKYIKTSFHISEDDTDFTPTVHLFDYGYIDSFGATEVIAFIEKTYNIEITRKDLMLFPMNTISEIAEVIESKVKGA